MSSTNRGAARQPDDFYRTPSWAAAAILPHLNRPLRVLDPACGDGALLKAAIVLWPILDDLDGMDIEDRGWPGTIIRDALDPELWPTANLILANPPFSLAMEFIERSLAEVARGGEVAFLLRLAWMAGQERTKFHRTNPSDVFVLPRRPSFTQHLKWTNSVSQVRCPLTFLTRAGGKKPCDMEAGHSGDCMGIGTDSADYAWFVWGPGRGGRWQVLDVGRAAA